VTGSPAQRISYSELLSRVSSLAGALKAAGVQRGDRVLCYLPMIPETVISMLAITRLGAIHSVVFGGFAAAELAKRIKDAAPTVILTASCGLESATKVVPYKPALDEAIRLSGHSPKKVLVFQRPQCRAELTPGRDEEWSSYVQKHGAPAAAVAVPANHPLYILYTSGTTGTPKGIVRDHGSIVALKASMSLVFGHRAEEVFWSASDLGWAVGHSYIVHGPLLQGSTSVLYEGKPVGTPDAGAFWRVISQHKVSVLLTAPTALRAIRKEDSEGKLKGKYVMSSFKALYLAGERADPASVAWARQLLNVPILDNW
jgi:propionyl-CoA synthetase